MKSNFVLRSSLGLAIALSVGNAAAEQPPSIEEMWRLIQAQQKEIAQLKAQASQTDQKVEATGEAIDSLQQSGGTSAGSEHAGDEQPGNEHNAPRKALGALGPQFALGSQFDHGQSGKTTVGGYGELHYNNLEGEGGATDKDEIDLHRAILFLGHEFNDDIRFFSEIEFEHAHTGVNGVVEVEQAYVEFDLNDTNHARAGLFLVPVGILNEIHEPASFYGVERNPVERDIVPTTWWVGGASLLGQLGQGFSYDVAAHEGMNASAEDDYKVRNGRQFTSEAVAKDAAITGRLKWTGMPGVEIAGTVQHQTDMAQSTDPTAGSANLYEMHTVLSKGPFGLHALYALWNLEGSGPAAVGADEQLGWYVEPAYKLTEKWGLFTRYSLWDNAAGNSTDSEKKQWDVGMNFWPHPYVVLKADYQQQDNDSGANRSGLNLGVGYQF